MTREKKPHVAGRLITTGLIVLSLFWAFLFSLTFYNRMTLLRNRDGFTKTTFTVTSVEYHPPTGDETGPTYWANGEVEGLRERMAIAGMLDREPGSEEGLASQIPVGTRYEVLYNPEMTDAIVQGETLRVMLYTEDFWEEQAASARKLGVMMFLPLAIAIVIKIGFLMLYGRATVVRDIAGAMTQGKTASEPRLGPEADTTDVRETTREAIETVPDAFTAATEDDNSLTIRFKRRGMGCMNIFLIFWLAGWTVGCVFLLLAYLRGGKMDDGDSIQWWFVAIFWAGEIGVACLLTYLLFCRKSFHLGSEKLTMVTDILGWKRTKVIPKDAMRQLVQVKDGGEDEDSFPSWGLKLHADKKTTLIFRQPYEVSHWLGTVMSKWAGIMFIAAPEEE